MRKIMLATVAALALTGAANAGVKCNDPAVISTFEDAYILNLFNYKASLGVKDLTELRSLDDEQIKQRYEAMPAQISMKKKAGFNAATAEVIQENFTMQENALIASKHMITSIEAAPTDYNPSIKKYTCDADLVFDQDNLRAIVYFMTYTNFLVNQGGKIAVEAGMQGNDLSGYKLLKSVKVSPVVEAVLTRVNSTLTFTVQAADIDKPDDTNFIFRSNLANGWLQQ
jgi:hypothetical protein